MTSRVERDLEALDAFFFRRFPPCYRGLGSAPGRGPA
jgi:hypothetical protein